MSTETAHLDTLAEAFTTGEWIARVVRHPGREPHLRVTNPEAPEITEEVVCRPAADGSPCYWWAWGLAICTVDEVDTAVQRIQHVLRTVRSHR